MSVLPFPKPQRCHVCEHSFAGSHCPLCKTERPAYTALKAISQREHQGVQPLRAPSACHYFPASICGCNHRGLCLGAA